MGLFDIFAWWATGEILCGVENYKRDRMVRREKAFEKKYNFNIRLQNKIEIGLYEIKFRGKVYADMVEAGLMERRPMGLRKNPTREELELYPPQLIAPLQRKMTKYLIEKEGYNYFDHDEWVKDPEYLRIYKM